MKTVYIVENKDIQRALNFAETATVGKSQSKRDFGSQEMRRKLDQIADISEGKIAEIGFSMFLQEVFNVEPDVDFNHYDGVKSTDFGNDLESLNDFSGDMRRCIYKVDIKTTKPYSMWLLVEGHKFWANAYVMVKTDLPRGFEKDPYVYLDGNGIKTEVVGFAYYSDFFDPVSRKPWIQYEQGDYLINPKDLKYGSPIKIKDLWRETSLRKLGLPLKSSVNYAIPASMLRKSKEEWQNLIYAVRASTIHIDDQIMTRRC